MMKTISTNKDGVSQISLAITDFEEKALEYILSPTKFKTFRTDMCYVLFTMG